MPSTEPLVRRLRATRAAPATKATCRRARAQLGAGSCARRRCGSTVGPWRVRNGSVWRLRVCGDDHVATGGRSTAAPRQPRYRSRRTRRRRLLRPIWGAAAMAAPAKNYGYSPSSCPAIRTQREQDGVLHGGLKYELSEQLHVDATIGAGIWGKEKVPLFATLGFRGVTE